MNDRSDENRVQTEGVSPVPMLTFDGVSKSFEHLGSTIEVLKEIDLEIHPADSLSVTGASGVGKSTLLNIMGSLDPPTIGTVRFNGSDIYEMDPKGLSLLRNREIWLCVPVSSSAA